MLCLLSLSGTGVRSPACSRLRFPGSWRPPFPAQQRGDRGVKLTSSPGGQSGRRVLKIISHFQHFIRNITFYKGTEPGWLPAKVAAGEVLLDTIKFLPALLAGYGCSFRDLEWPPVAPSDTGPAAGGKMAAQPPPVAQHRLDGQETGAEQENTQGTLGRV